jgi:hypothetical protein
MKRSERSVSRSGLDSRAPCSDEAVLHSLFVSTNQSPASDSGRTLVGDASTCAAGQPLAKARGVTAQAGSPGLEDWRTNRGASTIRRVGASSLDV